MHIIYSTKNNLGTPAFYYYEGDGEEPEKFVGSSSPEMIRKEFSKAILADIRLVLTESKLPQYCIERLRRNNEQVVESKELEAILKSEE